MAIIPHPLTNDRSTQLRMLEVAIEEAKQGLSEVTHRIPGIPIGAAVFDSHGTVLGRGHNRRVQDGDPSVHGETAAFRAAGRQRGYRDKIMVTTLAPCWYCSGLVRQFNFGMVIVGEAENFDGGVAWLRRHHIPVINLDSDECKHLLKQYIAAYPEIWYEDIGALDAPGTRVPRRRVDRAKARRAVTSGAQRNGSRTV